MQSFSPGLFLKSIIYIKKEFIALCFVGIQKGDRVAIYMPMIIELVVAMLACARIGAVHSIVVSKLYFTHGLKL